MRKEIDDLHDKVGEEERNSSELESKVKRLEGERDRLETRLTNLLKEQTVGRSIFLQTKIMFNKKIEPKFWKLRMSLEVDFVVYMFFI